MSYLISRHPGFWAGDFNIGCSSSAELEGSQIFHVLPQLAKQESVSQALDRTDRTGEVGHRPCKTSKCLKGQHGKFHIHLHVEPFIMCCARLWKLPLCEPPPTPQEAPVTLGWNTAGVQCGICLKPGHGSQTAETVGPRISDTLAPRPTCDPLWEGPGREVCWGGPLDAEGGRAQRAGSSRW